MERAVIYLVSWRFEGRDLRHTIYRDASGVITLEGWSADAFPDDNFRETLSEDDLAEYLAYELRGVEPKERGHTSATARTESVDVGFQPQA